MYQFNNPLGHGVLAEPCCVIQKLAKNRWRRRADGWIGSPLYFVHETYLLGIPNPDHAMLAMLKNCIPSTAASHPWHLQSAPRSGEGSHQMAARH